MQNHGYFSKPTFFEKIDIFGIAIAIRFNTLPSHNTHFGGFVTVSIIGIILYQLISVLMVLFAQTNPTVIVQEDYVFQPEPFQLKPDQFNFAIGMQDKTYAQFMDESIYYVKAYQTNMVRLKNQTTGELYQQYQNNPITLVPCTKDNFQIKQSQQYFLNTPFELLYCFKPSEENSIIEGEFSSNVYRAIQLDFYECIGDGCAPQSVKDKFLQVPTLGLFMSNNVIQITNKNDPKLEIGKNLYWKSGPALSKYVTINLMNNYINSDYAFYGKKVQQDRVVSFSSSAEQVLPRTSAVMYSVLIVYEKNREVNYYRSYLKLDQVELFLFIHLSIFIQLDISKLINQHNFYSQLSKNNNYFTFFQKEIYYSFSKTFLIFFKLSLFFIFE